MHEVLGLRTKSPLVFLSGCETGLGVGEGPFAQAWDEGSLAQSFLVARVGSVVATLWRVDDAEAVRLAAAFYGHLGVGVPPDALARAQRQAIHRHAGGVTWAAYAVSTAGRANPPPASVQLGREP